MLPNVSSAIQYLAAFAYPATSSMEAIAPSAMLVFPTVRVVTTAVLASDACLLIHLPMGLALTALSGL